MIFEQVLRLYICCAIPFLSGCIIFTLFKLRGEENDSTEIQEAKRPSNHSN